LLSRLSISNTQYIVYELNRVGKMSAFTPHFNPVGQEGDECGIGIVSAQLSVGVGIDDDSETADSYKSALTEYRKALNMASSVKREYDDHLSATTALLKLHNPNASEVSLSRSVAIGHDNYLSAEILQTPFVGVGGLLWTSSEIAAEEVIGLLKDLGPDDTIIELGCGAAALPSMAAAIALPATVIATDTGVVLESTRENIARNLRGKVLRGSIELRVCDWEQELSEDSGEEPLLATAVVAADVIYAERIYDALVHTISRILKPDGIFILTYAQRDEGAERLFFDKLKTDGGIDTRIVGSYNRESQKLFTVCGTKSPRLDMGIYL
jgi:SAM-dependent methyltransferase